MVSPLASAILLLSLSGLVMAEETALPTIIDIHARPEIGSTSLEIHAGTILDVTLLNVDVTDGGLMKSFRLFVNDIPIDECPVAECRAMDQKPSPAEAAAGIKAIHRGTISFVLMPGIGKPLLWGEVLRLSKQPQVTLSVGTGKPLGMIDGNGMSKPLPLFQPEYTITWRWIGGLVAGFLCLAAVLVAICCTQGLRDRLPFKPPTDRVAFFSLARAQMFWWTAIIFGVYGFLVFMTGQTDVLTKEAAILLAISSVTALAATSDTVFRGIVEKARALAAARLAADAALRPEQTKGIEMGTVASAALQFRALTSLDAHQSEIDAISAAWSNISAPYEAILTSLKSATDPLQIAQRDAAQELLKIITAARALLDTEIRLADELRVMKLEVTRLKAELIQDKWTAFLRDVTTDENGLSVKRLQLVLWSGAVGVYILTAVLTTWKFPLLDATTLSLIGISGGAYVWGKSSEHPLSPIEPLSPGKGGNNPAPVSA